MNLNSIRPQAWGVLALAAALQIPAQAAERWELADVEKFYLQDPPNSFTGLYRSQGIAWNGDAKEWIFTWQYGIERANKDYESLQRNSSFQLPFDLVPGIPLDLLYGQALDHIGDIDYANGIIYASLDTSIFDYNNGHVALFNAKDLSYTGISYELYGAPSNPRNDVASWVAVDPARGYGYGKEWQNGNTINVYKLEDWSFDHTITLDLPLKSIQGAKVRGDWLYLASDNSTQSIYRANLLSGHVEELFRLPTPAGDREVEGIAIKSAPNGGADLYVELIVDPDQSGQDLSNPNLHVRLYHYKLVAPKKSGK